MGDQTVAEIRLRTAADRFWPGSYLGPLLSSFVLICDRFQGRLTQKRLTQKESPTRGLTSGLWEQGSPQTFAPPRGRAGLPAGAHNVRS
jgi:hypothetical protein